VRHDRVLLDDLELRIAVVGPADEEHAAIVESPVGPLLGEHLVDDECLSAAGDRAAPQSETIEPRDEQRLTVA
jgi:hypothetical protein